MLILPDIYFKTILCGCLTRQFASLLQLLLEHGTTES